MKYRAILVQFRLPVGERINSALRYEGSESPEKSQLRHASTSERPLTQILARNGATFEGTGDRLEEAGYKLVDAKFERRTSKTNGKPYHLVTFYFRKESMTGNSKLWTAFDQLAANRYEYVTANASDGPETEQMLCLLAKAIAPFPQRIKLVDDPEAKELGIVVTKSIPKKRDSEQVVLSTGGNSRNTVLAEKLAGAIFKK
ncbi:MAG: hypothetical protein ACREGR_02970 [Minisyncoccia bacterium]